jgi:hypothetical protein
MDLLGNLKDKAMYAMHNAAYDPKAEEYAKERDEAAAKLAATKELNAKRDLEKKKAQIEKEEKAKAEELAKKERERRKNFNFGEFFQDIVGWVAIILGVVLLFAGAVYGSSLATNLNVYRTWPYRVLYALYGLVFFFIVIPYVLIYRWWFKGLRPRYYGLIPLVPYKFSDEYIQFFFGWMTFRPDTSAELLREWIK